MDGPTDEFITPELQIIIFVADESINCFCGLLDPFVNPLQLEFELLFNPTFHTAVFKLQLLLVTSTESDGSGSPFHLKKKSTSLFHSWC